MTLIASSPPQRKSFHPGSIPEPSPASANPRNAPYGARPPARSTRSSIRPQQAVNMQKGGADYTGKCEPTNHLEAGDNAVNGERRNPDRHLSLRQRKSAPQRDGDRDEEIAHRPRSRVESTDNDAHLESNSEAKSSKAATAEEYSDGQLRHGFEDQQTSPDFLDMLNSVNSALIYHTINTYQKHTDHLSVLLHVLHRQAAPNGGQAQGG